MDVLKIYDQRFQELIKSEVRSILLDTQNKEENTPVKTWSPEKSTLSCSYCRIQFDNANIQRDHYKLDWHRYNLKQSLCQREPITEEEFDVKTTKDDLSSISGSDSSDSEKEDNLDSYATAQGKIFLQNDQGTVFSIYASLLYEKKEELSNELLHSRLHSYAANQNTAVLMLGGGHFAGAIFHKDTPILHKTFHCYTVRAGQGGAQSSRDNKSGGSQPKSAGASLRRYNEQALVQHVKSILETWQTELDKCNLIFYRAAGPYNKTVLFGGSTPLLKRGDERLRAVPFSTRRATFAEVVRIFGILSHVQVYDCLQNAIESFSRKKINDQGAKKVKVKTIDRARSREMIERPLPVDIASSDSDSDVLELSTELKEISFDNLKEFDDVPKVPKKKKAKLSKAKKLKLQEELRKNEVIQLIAVGNTEKLSELLDNCLRIDQNEKDSFVNEVLDEQGNSLLHVAALHERSDVLLFLLDNDANLCAKNQKQQTPYTCTQSKIIREDLKNYAKNFPDKYNYNKAQIPTNVLTPEELSEKKKAQRKVKKEKEKIKRKENEIKKKEEQEKDRFLKLSDREKRALAAERRILNQSGTVTSRCFLCGGDMQGKVPFEYLNNRFCSIDCLKGHRMQHSTILS